jgi:hypothetical protein
LWFMELLVGCAVLLSDCGDGIKEIAPADGRCGLL